MIHLPILARAPFAALFAAARSAVCISRFLLLVIAVEAITMPVTQGLWSWDKFLHGGQDFELSFLMTITCLCLILLRVQDSERHPSLFGALLPGTRKRTVRRVSGISASFEHRCHIPSPFRATAFNRPLLI